MSWNLTTRVFASTAAIVTVVVGAAFVIGSASLRRASDDTARRGLEQAVDLVAQFLDGRQHSLAGGVRVFVKAPYFRTLVAERRRDDLLDQSFEAAAQLDAHWVMITDGRGVLLAKSDEPELTVDSLGGVPLVAGALRGGTISGFGVSRDSSLFQAVAVPIVIPGSAPVGVLVATRLIDSLFAADVKAATSAELLFYGRDSHGDLRVSASTIGKDSEVVAAAELMAQEPPGHSGVRPKLRVHGSEYFAEAASLATAGGDPIGGFVVLRPREGAPASLVDIRRSLAIAGVLGLLLSLAFAYFAARRITQPVRALAQAVQRAADGDYDAASLNGTSTTAEIGALTSAYASLLADLRDKDLLVETLVSGSGELRSDTGASEGASPAVRRIGLAKTGRGSAAIGVGTLLANRYYIETQVGSGGMGIVYRATDRLLGEPVAVKVLRPEVVAADPLAFARFTEELRMARRITHRNVVRTHDLAEHDGVPFLTMEFVKGASLSSIIKARGALPAAAIISIGKQLMRALAVAHEQGVVHGDLKPQNVLIGANGVSKVTDFGVARLVRSAMPERQRMLPNGDQMQVARLSGAVVGTPEYLSPEVLLGAPASPASDIYAAGMVLHECLTGATPFQADTPAAFLTRKMDTAMSAPARLAATLSLARSSDEPAEVTTQLQAMVARMTDPDPARRPGSAREVADGLASMAEARDAAAAAASGIERPAAASQG
jgi:HAMP domain-containing protein